MTSHLLASHGRSIGRLAAAACVCAALGAGIACSSSKPSSQYRTFASPDDAVKGLTDAVKAGNLNEVKAIFGPESAELIDNSDPTTARRNREVFLAAIAEKQQLVDDGPRGTTLVVGNEEWPFPVPIIKDGSAWRFDGAAGNEEVLARRIGRNELAVMRICKTYVGAQRLYALRGHDGKPAGLFAKAFNSDAGKENGLYWPTAAGRKRSPLGDLVAQAAEEGRGAGPGGQRASAFHGYHFKILTAQGQAAAGGAKNYLVNGEMAGGFALVAWPAKYQATGIMTFIINQDGVVREKDLGPEATAGAATMALFDPDDSWVVVP